MSLAVSFQLVKSIFDHYMSNKNKKLNDANLISGKIDIAYVLKTEIDNEINENKKLITSFEEKIIHFAFEIMKDNKLYMNIISILLNIGLLTAFIKSTEKNNICKSDSIAGVLLEKKIKSFTYCYIILIISLLVSSLFYFLDITKHNGVAITVITAAIACTFINQQILKYRISKGYYGTSRYETIEILEFIQKHAEKTDFIDKNGNKKLFPTIEEKTECKDIGLVEA